MIQCPKTGWREWQKVGDLLLPPRYRDMEKLEKTETKDKRARRLGKKG